MNTQQRSKTVPHCNARGVWVYTGKSEANFHGRTSTMTSSLITYESFSVFYIFSDAVAPHPLCVFGLPENGISLYGCAKRLDVKPKKMS